MPVVRLTNSRDYACWRAEARRLLAAGVAPWEVVWAGEDDVDLFSGAENGDAAGPGPGAGGSTGIRVPKAFPRLAETVLCHSDGTRLDLLYRLLVRLQVERHLLDVTIDPDVIALNAMARSVGRDCHTMQAFVRFREVADGAATGRRRFVAWYEPDHFIVARTAPFFCRRFSDMDWAILTPKGSAVFAEGDLTLSSEPAERPGLSDDTDDLWRVYYSNIFNPARLKVRTMKSKMPKRYWANLPEAAVIPALIAGAGARVARMADPAPKQPPDAPRRGCAAPDDAACPVEETAPSTAASLAELRAQIAACRRCPLHCAATQAVCGEGPTDAPLMFVGEQPGDQEDIAGRPFIGPAGKVFDGVLRDCGLDRGGAYVTNAVKHFKFEPRGRVRIHKTANAHEVSQCRWWVSQELSLVKPRVVVTLGATALKALTGTRQTLTSLRGRFLPFENDSVLFATVHPSYLLRLPDAGRKAEEMARFREDIRAVAAHPAIGLHRG